MDLNTEQLLAWGVAHFNLSLVPAKREIQI
jgi:glutamyl-Q tRNA(Asp) synthetase